MTPIGDVLAKLTGQDEPAAGAHPLEAFARGETLPHDQHPAYVYIARLAEGSRPAQRSALRELARLLSRGRQGPATLPWHRIRYQHTAALRAVLVDRYAPATVNRYLAALRGVLREAWQLGLMTTDDYHRAIVAHRVNADRLIAGRALSHGELRQLFAVCAEDLSPRGRRDAALLAMLYGLGLRRAEAASVQLQDVDLEQRRVVVRQGKRRREREVYAGPGTAEALADWIATRGGMPGPLLCRMGQDGPRYVVELNGITPQAIYWIIGRLGRSAAIAAFTPHDCRRTYIGELLDAGADLSIVRQLVGHANVNTTARYDRRGEEAKVRASALLPVPYLPPRKPQEAAGDAGEGFSTRP